MGRDQRLGLLAPRARTVNSQTGWALLRQRAPPCGSASEPHRLRHFLDAHVHDEVILRNARSAGREGNGDASRFDLEGAAGNTKNEAVTPVPVAVTRPSREGELGWRERAAGPAIRAERSTGISAVALAWPGRVSRRRTTGRRSRRISVDSAA